MQQLPFFLTLVFAFFQMPVVQLRVAQAQLCSGGSAAASGSIGLISTRHSKRHSHANGGAAPQSSSKCSVRTAANSHCTAVNTSTEADPIGEERATAFKLVLCYRFCLTPVYALSVFL